ncbi:sulfate adenylyltransferase subunit CysN [Campylobacter hepaticus]|uniref:sulfate adenylyltransferase n=1 Tax=Campylobacter hepaticus TaxID=1813019 RepID=A0A424YYX3_9BACT|nr:sulfate adenylyltransferase subunit CysN [Campylobacter hepaticus]AXP09059.1 sulfate adenylyltransferase subunit CysN [Campylobacter hepaticus]MDX2324026.1 sulfate adenylyltransferase subunit CysN [Campylobacter hepaticus]MDX2331843.1 sulfate adenylyltransferase subunit CysN [Campylobacter hepaticus]MDX2333294.1 sulfate adenylyltransferase subunit CysN [Campylobacter hepaticus]MDX2372455.1 sulfate adenylyltransferase subunit CysN [Campylobacter hepaticus]
MQNIKKYLNKHTNKELCRFITCGSVDDGKSTLIGRLLYDTKSLFDDQLKTLKKDSKRIGNAGNKLDFALLVDGLSSEREQGITIDVAYRFFTSNKRNFIIADTPGHEQYTRNMATGASTADIAIILIDSRKGVLTQTKRHSYIVSLLGIKHFIIAINKMDLVSYDEKIFNKICKDYQEIIPYLQNNIKTHFIPICALNGENIIKKSKNFFWYKGATLLKLLDNIKIDKTLQDNFILPIQYVNRPHLNFRGFCGNIISGHIKLQDEVIILPSMQKSKIKSIVTSDIKDLKVLNTNEVISTQNEAFNGMAVNICLEDEIDISRGDILTSINHNLNISNIFEAMIIWMNEKTLNLEENYLIKRAHNLCNVKFKSINYKKNINTFQQEHATKLMLNDIAHCTLKLDTNLALKEYENNKILGSFIIIHKYSNETLAAGMIMKILDSKQDQKIYTQAEIELNAFIRKNYPEWECKKI